MLPIAIGMIVINGLNVINVMVGIGLFYLAAGCYFRIPIPVQPMKVIGAYAIAASLTPNQIVASSLWMGGIMLLLGTTGLIHLIGKYTPKCTVRGVQMGVGIILMTKGLRFMIEPDPNLTVQFVGPIGMGILLGCAGLAVTFFLLDNQKLPAAVVVVGGGILLGLVIGHPITAEEIRIGFHLPALIPYGLPSGHDLLWVLPVLVIPQIPMTIGNAVLSNTDLAKDYFKDRAHRVSYRSIANSQGIAGVASFILGGIPMCHGAGGLAAMYRFGARSAGANLMIGGIFISLGVLFGQTALALLNLLPLSLLGVLLVFAGAQLALMIQDVREKKDLFVVLLMLGITLTTNLAIAFISGIAVALVLKTDRISI